MASRVIGRYSDESRKVTTDRKVEVLSTKSKARIGFRNVRTMYETGKLAQVTSEMKRYNLHILGISESTDRRGLEDSEPIPERHCYSEEEMRGEDYRQSDHIEWKLVMHENGISPDQ